MVNFMLFEFYHHRKEEFLPFPTKKEKQKPNLPPCPKQPKRMDKIYETMIFRTLYIRQQRTVIPERQGTNEANSMIAPVSNLKEFPGHSTQRGNPGGIHQTPQYEETQLSLERSRH